jgi:L-threonylcarbamoyladenylate synthase
MKIIKYSEKDRDLIIKEAIAVIKKGGIVSYPTESFYALGVMAEDKGAVEKIYALKHRPADKPLPVIVGDLSTLQSVVRAIPGQAQSLIDKFWPGPLTLVFEAQSNLSELLTGSTGKVAVRIPGESVALYIAKEAGFPITATSANISAMAPAVDAKSVRKYFDDSLDLIINGANAPGGKSSTIVDITVSPPVVLRKGSIVIEILNIKNKNAK